MFGPRPAQILLAWGFAALCRRTICRYASVSLGMLWVKKGMGKLAGHARFASLPCCARGPAGEKPPVSSLPWSFSSMRRCRIGMPGKSCKLLHPRSRSRTPDIILRPSQSLSAIKRRAAHPKKGAATKPRLTNSLARSAKHCSSFRPALPSRAWRLSLALRLPSRPWSPPR